jgi:hypothetical protein
LIRVLFPYIIVIFIYLLAYFSFRLYYPGTYDGTQIGNFAPMDFFKVIFRFSISSFPTYIFWNYGNLFSSYSDFFGNHQYNLIYIFQNLRVEWMVKAVLFAYFVFIILKKRLEIFSRIKFYITLVISISLVILPTLLFAVTPKYQNWVRIGGKGYTVTFFCFFGMVLLISSIIMYFNQVFRSKKLSKCYTIVIITFVILSSILTDYSNYFVAKSQVQTQMKWDIFNLFIGTDEYKDIPANSIVYAPTLWGDIGYPETYWEEYAYYKTGKKLKIVKSKDQLGSLLNLNNEKADIFFLKYSQEQKEPNQYIILSKVEDIVNRNNNYYFYSDSANVYYYSKNKQFLLFFSLRQADNNPISINNYPIGTINNDFYAIQVNANNPQDILTHTVVKSINIDLNSIFISNFLNYEQPITTSNISSDFGGGFSVLEYTETGDWRWCGKNGIMTISNYSENDKTIDMTMNFATGYAEMSNLQISYEGFSESIKINYEPTPYKKRIMIDRKSVV